MKRSFLVSILLLPVLLARPAMASPALDLRAVDASRFPNVKMAVMLSGVDPVRKLEKRNFSLKENGEPVGGFEVRDISTPANPMGVVLVVDTSGSMYGTPLEDAKNAASAFIQAKGVQDKIAIVGFSSVPTKLVDFTDDAGILNNAVNRLSATGGTSLYDALALAVESLSKSSFSQKNVIVLSDGKDTESLETEQSVVAKALAIRANLFTVALKSTELNTASLESVAQKTNGKFLMAPNSGALTGLYAQLANELHNQYEISYYSKANTRDVNLSLTVDSADLTVGGKAKYANPSYRLKPASFPAVKTRAGAPSFKTTSEIVLLMSLAGVFVAVSLFVVNLLGALFPGRSLLKKQIDFYEEVFKRSHAEAKEVGKKGAEFYEHLLRATGLLAERRGFNEAIQLLLVKAGVRLKANEFILLHLVGVLFFSIVAYITTEKIWVSLLATVLGTALPLFYLQLLIERRKDKFNRQLPDVLTMLAGSLRSGYSFLHSLNVVVEECQPPISLEFKKVLVEARLGLSLERALLNMAERVGSTDFNWTVMAINIQREVGGNLAEVFDILANTMRERERIRRQIKALTAEGRLSAIILYVLPFAIGFILAVTNPAYIATLFSTGLGIAMVVVALALMAIGGLWLRKTVSIEV
ncbi:MAG: VWA domain-containing protein [Actinobacteria bacterium]|nr:VWA domain-containing protein [Actinomycetota bacterium]